MQIFFVAVKIKTPAGELSTPLGWTERQQDAVAAAERMRELLQLVANEPVGPERIPLREVLGVLGIMAINIVPMGAEVAGPIATPPTPRIIL